MGIIIKLVLFIHEFLKNEFVNDVDFGDLYQQQRNNATVAMEDNKCHLQKFYCATWTCYASHMEKKLVHKEDHTLRFVIHFGTRKTMKIMQRYV